MSTSTHVSLLTARGRSAIAVIAVQGEQATTAVEQFFQPLAGGALESKAVGRVLFGDWQRDLEQAGEGVVVRRVGETAWEIHPHGGTAAAQAILDDLTSHGCQPQEWQAALTGSLNDPLEIAATLALPRATTERTAAHLLAQRRGTLREAITKIQQQLASDERESALAAMQQLLESSRWGLHLTQPWKVLLCGSPNVGKSSLINALLGYSRAIVFDAPGTTRDVLTAATAIAGWPVELTDTAGIRSSTDALEAAGIERSRAALDRANVVIPVIDLAASLTADDHHLLDLPNSSLVIGNKADLPHRTTLAECAAPGRTVVATSATTGEGIAQLLNAIAERIVPQQPAYNAPTLFTIEQLEQVQTALAHCQRGDMNSASAALP